MNVLFLMFVYPDMNKSFNMYTTLVEEFVANGHNVVVLAPGDNKTANRYEKGVEILRVQTLPIKNVPNFLKGISNLLLPYQYDKALKKFHRSKKFDLIIIPTPPITLVDLCAKLKKKFNACIYLILRDIFPQNAVDLGIIKKDSILYYFFRRKESKLYCVADYIGCMSQGNIDYLTKNNKHLDVRKLHVLKNFQKPYSGYGYDQNELKRKYCIEGKFVVVFGGNMGKPQQMENVVELAERSKKYPNITFLLLGEGLYVDKTLLHVKKKQLTNILIRKTIPKQEFQDLISCCNVGLISLHKDFTIPNIPSKALDYFNVGLPVLASIDKATDFGRILDEERCGLWSYASDHLGLFCQLEQLYFNRELCKELGLNAKSYFTRELQPATAYETVIGAME